MLDTERVQEKIIELTESLSEYVKLKSKPKSKLSRTAKKRLADIESELRSLLDPVERSDFIYDAGNIGKFFGVTARTVQKWVSLKGCPRLRHGVYDLKAVHEWWLENVRGDDKASSPEIEDAKLEYWKWKARREKISVQKLREQLLDRKDVARQWALRVGEVTAGLNMLKDRLPPLIMGKSRRDVALVVEHEVMRLREAYARRGEHCHTEEQ